MRKQPVIIASMLGAVLFSFQNCSPAMQASQEFGNDIYQDSRKTPETGEDLSAESAMLQQSIKAQAYCPTTDFKIQFPFGDLAYRDWIIYNYVDNDRASGPTRDYMGNVGSAALTYDQHKGIDIDVPSFRAMDNNYPVLAVAAGVVTAVYDDSYDRNSSCKSEQWNFVKVKHDNGFFSMYGHLKKDSVVVSVGQRVAAGQKLGVVGSSGCSTGPHLHLEMIDCNGALVDPMKAQMFLNPPLYSKRVSTTVMDTYIKQPSVTSMSQLRDPGPTEPSSIKMNQYVTLGVTYASLKPNDVVRLEFIMPNGVKDDFYLERVNNKYYVISTWYWDTYFPTAGVWKVRYLVNGTLKQERTINVLQ